MTPYITPPMLLDPPAGISWHVVPLLRNDDEAQLAQLWDVCRKAHSIVDTFCRQPIKATVNTDTDNGPGQPRIGYDRDTGVGFIITRRWPVTQVAAVQLSPARSFPPNWQQVPSTDILIRRPPILSAVPGPGTAPTGGTAIDLAPQWIQPGHPRGYWRVLYSYVSGWPHCSLTEAAEQDATEVTVDDVAGWGESLGVGGILYDGKLTEPTLAVTGATATSPIVLPGVGATVEAGPGTLTLSTPLAVGHKAGAVLSAVPADVIHASVLAATVEAVETIDAIATQSMSGELAGGTDWLEGEYQRLLSDYRRII